MFTERGDIKVFFMLFMYLAPTGAARRQIYVRIHLFKLSILIGAYKVGATQLFVLFKVVIPLEDGDTEERSIWTDKDVDTLEEELKIKK